MAVTPSAHGPRSIGVLVLGLARLGLFGFGGVGPQAYAFFVEQSGWLSADEFAERFSVAQALPGANAVNLCAIVADRWFGPVGAIAAVAAITLPPLVVVLFLAAALAHAARTPRFIAAECAVVAASAGLVFATAFRVLATIARHRAAAGAIAAAVALGIGTHLVSMPLATLTALACGFAVAALARDRR